MVAHSVEWEALLAHPQVIERLVVRSGFGIMAFHGGLEAGTSEIALAVAAAAGCSAYTVDQPADLRWHVPSRDVDPGHSALLDRFLGHVLAVVAIHGYGRPFPPHHILVGGANRSLAGEVAKALRSAFGAHRVIDDLAAIPPRLRGVHHRNPVNLVSGGGVQLEIPVELRRSGRDELASALAGVAIRHAGPAPRFRQPDRW